MAVVCSFVKRRTVWAMRTISIVCQWIGPEGRMLPVGRICWKSPWGCMYSLTCYLKIRIKSGSITWTNLIRTYVWKNQMWNHAHMIPWNKVGFPMTWLKLSKKMSLKLWINWLSKNSIRKIFFTGLQRMLMKRISFSIQKPSLTARISMAFLKHQKFSKWSATHLLLSLKSATASSKTRLPLKP